MHPPDELMVSDFLPSIRQLVSRRLSSQGFSQNRISAMMGVTQASVSHYLAASPSRAYETLASLSLVREEADRYGALLAEDIKRSPVEGVRALVTLWTGLLGRGLVCPAHRAMYPSLSECDVCLKEFGAARRGVPESVASVAEAARRLESSPEFISVMPEVSVNIACVSGDATSPTEVVAIPGRIVRVRGRAKASSSPEAGASRHLSKVLLLVRSRLPTMNACINIRYDVRVSGIMRRLGLKKVELSAYPLSGVIDPTLSALTLKLSKETSRFDVVVDRGGEGIEPNTYLFADSVEEVTRLALEIARLYSADQR